MFRIQAGCGATFAAATCGNGVREPGEQCDDGNNATGDGCEPDCTFFRLFQRGGHSDVPGEGVGLTIVRKIIERHGGTVWVDSVSGDGATFWFSLPKMADAAATESAPPASALAAPRSAA